MKFDDIKRFSDCLQEDVVSVSRSDMSLDAGFMSKIQSLCVKLKSGDQLHLVEKDFGNTVDPNYIEALGCRREADLYRSIFPNSGAGTVRKLPIDPALSSIVPRVYSAESDKDSGAKKILMEDLCSIGAVNSSYFFGSDHPINKKKDLASLTAPFPLATPLEIARITFVALAQIHAHHWRRRELLAIPWLSAGWSHEEKKKDLEKLREKWIENYVKMKEAEKQHPTIPSALMDSLDAASAKFTWKNFSRQSRKSHFTLIHGDFNPGNVMLMPVGDENNNNFDCSVKFLDWEFVGLGSGSIDLGQYVISHLDVGKYGKTDHEYLIKSYHEELIRSNPSIAADFTFDRCWKEFVFSGFHRWLWMLPTSVRWCPEGKPYFVKQVEGFRKMHGVESADVGCPIV